MDSMVVDVTVDRNDVEHVEQRHGDDNVVVLDYTPSGGENMQLWTMNIAKQTFATREDEEGGGIRKTSEEIDVLMEGGSSVDNKGDVRGDNVKEDDVVNKGVSGEKCVIVRKRCKTHMCDTKSIQVSTKDWKWIEKKKQYGYVHKKTTKYICDVRRQGGYEVSDNASASARFPRLGNKGVEVGRFLADINPNDITRDPNLADKSERTNQGKLSETELNV